MTRIKEEETTDDTDETDGRRKEEGGIPRMTEQDHG
jgi:hypothetical protein